MIQKPIVFRQCISCKKTYERNNLIRITRDHNLGIILEEGFGRSAYICKSKKCFTDSKIKKKLEKALKSNINQNFFDVFQREIANYK